MSETVLHQVKTLINDLSTPEKAQLGNVYFITKERLACQAKILGDVTAQPMAVPEEALKKKARGPIPSIKKIYRPGKK